MGSWANSGLQPLLQLRPGPGTAGPQDQLYPELDKGYLQLGQGFHGYTWRHWATETNGKVPGACWSFLRACDHCSTESTEIQLRGGILSLLENLAKGLLLILCCLYCPGRCQWPFYYQPNDQFLYLFQTELCSPWPRLYFIDSCWSILLPFLSWWHQSSTTRQLLHLPCLYYTESATQYPPPAS